MGAIAGEVLAERDLEAAEPAEHDADADHPRVAADDTDDQHTMPASTVSSASGNEPQGAGGRSSVQPPLGSLLNGRKPPG